MQSGFLNARPDYNAPVLDIPAEVREEARLLIQAGDIDAADALLEEARRELDAAKAADPEPASVGLPNVTDSFTIEISHNDRTVRVVGHTPGWSKSVTWDLHEDPAGALTAMLVATNVRQLLGNVDQPEEAA